MNSNNMFKSGFVLIFSIFSIALIAQNNMSYFKAIPQIDSETPNWAKEMYHANANVKKVLFEYDHYFKKNEFQKTIHTQNFKHWLRFVEPLMNEEGYIVQQTKKEQDAIAYALKEKRNSVNKSTQQWTSIGPFETYKNGTTTPYSNHANVYSMDQSLNDANILIAGAEGGGVFYSSDKAESWELITKEEVFSNGVTAVKIDPDSDNTFIISANSRLYRTSDGGSTWTEILYIDGSANEIVFDPADGDHIYVTTNKGLFESDDDGNTWTTVFTETCWDLDYHPTNNSTVYLLKSNASAKKTEFYKSTNGGTTWNLITSGWYSPQVLSEASENGGKIAVSQDDPNRVYACLIGASKADDNGWIGLYRSNDSGTTWTLPSGQIGGPYQSPNTMPWNAAAYTSGYHQGYYNFDCEASPNDADLVWFGTVRLSETSDGGTTYQAIGAANSNRLSDMHADIQDIETNGTDVWVASDGGINFSNDDLQSHESKKYGIIGSDFWGFGTGWNDDVMVGGKYHNGNTAYYQSYGTGYSHNVGGVEEATGYVNPLENRKVYFNEYWAGGIKKREIADALGGSAPVLATYSLIPNESYSESSSSGYFFDPRYADHIYAGRDSVIYKSTNGGNSFDVLHDFNTTGKVFEIAISRANPDVIYAVFQPGGGYWDWCEIHKSTDAGTTWSKLSDVPTNSRWRLEFCLNHENENEIWVTANSGNNGQKVYRSTDGGNSWENMTSDVLDNEALKDVYHQGGSGGFVYVVSQTGFFYYDPNTASWVDYSTGLPLLTNALKISPFYRDSKMRMASSGRGIWEVDFIADFDPISQPITYSDTINCSRDTVLFDSYSIIEGTGASYSWTITPSPSYISSATTRNPKVVFGSDGSYDVSLEVTDGNGNSDSQSISNMVTVINECLADSIPGDALICNASGDYVQLPSMQENTNSFTITAWINPNGIQPEYAGVVMNDGDAAGLNFREANNTLAYHWPGGQWWWDSGLEVPSNQWSYVALVAEPSKMTLYLNGVAAVHNIGLNVVDIGTMKIGSYKAWGSRNYTGQIDEVTMWKKALTQEEIREWRHLTKEDIVDSDPDLIAYYQFNSSSSKVLDKVGLKHGDLSGSAIKDRSLAPIGGGVSHRLMVNSAGNYSFGDTGADIDFAGGTLPNGEIVVSRINLIPKASPSTFENIEKYWIVNNYGNNSFSNLNAIKFNDPDSNPGSSTVLSSVVLLKREDSNAFTNNWNQICSATSVGSGDTGFYNFESCGINSFSQFYVKDDCLHHQYLTKDYFGNESVLTGGSIEASNLINDGADVKYESQCIELVNDFEVIKGAVFEVLIGGCGI